MDRSIRASTSSASSTRVVDVLVPVALNQAYSYRVPRGVELKPGDVVSVPLGPREVIAVVWAENANPDPRLHNRLKDVGEKLDVPPLQEELRTLVDWVANYTLSARGMVLRMTLRMGENLGPERMRMGVRLIGEPPRAHDAGAAAADRYFSDGLLHGKSEAAKEAGVSAGVIDGLVDEGTLTVEPMPRALAPPAPDPSFAEPELFPPAAHRGRRHAGAGRERQFQAALLDGVTGSGKTEVYFEAIAEVIRRGRQIADPDAGDRADRAISRSLRAAFRRAAAGMAFGTDAAHPRAQLGSDMRRAKRRSWSVRARRCSCLMPIWG